MTKPAAVKSTTVRARQTTQLRATRAGFAVLERMSPALGARWAVRLWCRPPHAAGRRRDDRPGPGRVTNLAAAGSTSLVVETWGHGPPVYLLHGWGGWRGQLGGFIEPLVDAGYRAVAVDAPSHGDSGAGTIGRGKSTLIEFAQTITAVAAAHGAPAALITHSMGGAAAALAIRDGLLVPRAVFVAPAADPVAQVAAFASFFGLGPRTHRRMVERLRRLVDRPMAELDVRTLEGERTPPTLVIHDRDDREVSYGDGVAIANSWPEAELMTTVGLGHRRILRDEHVIQSAVDYVRGGQPGWRGHEPDSCPGTRTEDHAVGPAPGRPGAGATIGAGTGRQAQGPAPHS